MFVPGNVVYLVAMHHYCTMLILLLTSVLLAQLLSVGLVLLFGEIVPQALCKAHSLAIGAKTAPLGALKDQPEMQL